MKAFFLKAAVFCIAVLVCFGCVSTGSSGSGKAVEEKSMTAPPEPPKGAVAVNDNTMGNGINQYEYSEGWNYGPGGGAKYQNDDHYSGIKDAYYQLRFIGTNIKVYGTRDAHHGDAMVSIDGGPEVKVTYKNAKREYQYLIFDSGKLSPGEHILKVTVAGNGVVTADRADITK